VRIEHIQPSRCRTDFLERVQTNDAIKHEAKVKGGERAARGALFTGLSPRPPRPPPTTTIPSPLSPPYPSRPAEKPPSLKRAVKGPRDGYTLTNVKLETMTAIPYDILKEGIQ
jgi:large subunit ribosomal protein L21e